ncbi:MAG TPA: hypothetical protein PKD37_02620 [Oligoflexia bacterium]|nr:hypothetical protein [Oligoflexia bacterium]HMP26864.1 hypothetical protein [Oligoflexia bacterium]
MRIFPLTILLLLFNFIFLAEQSSAQPIRINKIDIFDLSEVSGYDVDLSQNVCDPTSNPPLLEKFSQTIIGLTVVNPLRTAVRFNSVRFELPRSLSSNKKLKSIRFYPLGNFEVPALSKEIIKSHFLRIIGDKKYFTNHKREELQPADGYQTVKIILQGRSTRGQKINLQTKLTVNFAEINRCDNAG